jgi:RHS repeat-associated protein
VGANDVMEFSYDAADQLTNAVWKASSTTNAVAMAYDALGRLTKETQTVGTASSLSVSYEYFADGRRKKLIYPDGSFVTYEYTTNGWLKAVKDSGTNTVVSYEYNAAGYRTKRTLANNTFTEYQYDGAGQLTNLVHKVINGGATNVLSSYAYRYDDAGYRKWVKRSSGRGDVYKYDASDQLTNVVYDATNPDTTPSGGTNLVTYYFDPAANRTSVVQVIPNTSTNTITYLVNKLNQYTNVSNQTYTYDAKGNLTNDGSQTYTYDYESRLIEAYAYPYTYTYSYDVLGRLAGRKRGTVWNRYYYAGWQLIEERAHAGGLLAKYVYGPGLDEPVRMYRSSTNYYYHTDGLGNVTEITDGSGNLVEQYSYDVYGKPTIRDGSTNVLSGSAIGNRLMFNARDRDPDTLIYNYRYRYYSPGLGRFVQPDPVLRLSRDPIQEYGDNNLYSYISNNPINGTDPLGLKKDPDYVKKAQQWRAACHLAAMTCLSACLRPFARTACIIGCAGGYGVAIAYCEAGYALQISKCPEEKGKCPPKS